MASLRDTRIVHKKAVKQKKLPHQLVEDMQVEMDKKYGIPDCRKHLYYT